MDNYNDKIERYLTDQMSTEENEAFLNELRNDAELNEEAQMMALMIKEMKEEQVRRNEVIIGEVLAIKRKRIIRIVGRSLSVAAMFVLIFGVTLLWNRQPDNKKLFSDYYTSYTMQGGLRGGNSDVEEDLAELFNQMDTINDVTPIIEELQKIYDSIDSEYEYSLMADDITWYLALAYLKVDKLEKAKMLLKHLAEKGNEKAAVLVKEIK